MAFKDLMNWFNRKPTSTDIKEVIDSKRDSTIDAVLAPYLQAVSFPATQFNTFKIDRAVKDGYSSANIVYRCVNIISDALVLLDYGVQDEKEQPVEKHILNDLLDNPNSEIPPRDVWSLFFKQLELVGSTYLRVSDTKKRPELMPIYPDKIEVVPSREKGKLLAGYMYMGPNGREPLSPLEVIHFKQIDPSNGLAGISALRAAYRHVDILNEMDKWNYNSFLNRVLADVIIQLKADNLTAEQIQVIRESIERQISGSDNARKAIIAPGATKVERFSNTAVEMDFIAGKKITREDIAVAYGVPLPMLGIYENGTFSNVESAKRDFWEDTILPKADGFVDTLTWFFRRTGHLRPNERITYNTKNIKALQRNYSDRVKDARAVQDMMFLSGYEAVGTFEELNKRFELGIQTEGIDIEEVLQEQPTEENTEEADTPSGDPKEPAKDKEDQAKDKQLKKRIDTPKRSMTDLDWQWRNIDRKKGVWSDRSKRSIAKAFKEENKAVQEAIEKNGVDAKAIFNAIKANSGTWDNVFSDIYSGVIGDFAKQKPKKRAGVKDKTTYEGLLNESIQGYINRNTAVKVRGIQAKTMKDIERIIRKAKDKAATVAEVQGEIQDLDLYLTQEVASQVGSMYGNFTASRSLTIARTEVAGASGYGQQQGLLLSGTQTKQWVASRDSATRDSHDALDGQIVNVDEDFDNGLAFPGDPSGGPDEVINCRCAMVAGPESDDEDIFADVEE